MSSAWWRLFADEGATTAVEYAVMLALIIMVALGAIFSFGTNTGGLWGGISSDIVTSTGS